MPPFKSSRSLGLERAVAMNPITGEKNSDMKNPKAKSPETFLLLA
jgi:hypothetical protein